MQTEIGNIKSVQQKQAQTLQNEEKHHHNIEDRIRELELCNRKLEFENYELNENFLRNPNSCLTTVVDFYVFV
jgi:hypothetical protein